MKAIILAGGRGSRLGELTEYQPKPLIKINDKPILEHLITNASKAGIKDYIICTGYLGNMIKDYFGNGTQLGVSIEYIDIKTKCPEQPIFIARKNIIDENICCFCADNILTTSNIKRILETYSKNNADAVFTLDYDIESNTTKRVQVLNNKIISNNPNNVNPVLVYNAVIRTNFIDILYDAVKDNEDMSFALEMNTLATKHNIYALNIPFININHPEDILKAKNYLDTNSEVKNE
jgi:NDP-sugar pyrophosphorylase family protein